MTRILTFCGSLRTASSNAAVLDALGLLAPPGVTVARYKGLASLPHFNPDHDSADAPDLLPMPVRDLRREIGLSDALVISSPEYAHGVAGSLKNALDWLVASLEFAGKLVALINTAPRAKHADAQLREVLATMAARLVEPASITVPVSGVGRSLDPAGVAADAALARDLRAAMAALLEAGAKARNGQL